MSNVSDPFALGLDAGTHILSACGLGKNGQFCEGSYTRLTSASTPDTTTASPATRAWWKFWG